jgi:DNA-binding transcriptional LysR family regulator
MNPSKTGPSEPFRLRGNHAIKPNPQNSDSSVSIRELFGAPGNSKSLESLIESRDIELGIGVDDGSFSKFEKHTLLKGQFVLTRSSKNKKLHFPHVYLLGDKGIETAVLRSQTKDRANPARFIEVQSWELIAQLAAKGVGVGLVPDFLLDSEFLQKIFNES